jgi:adenylate cyclase
VNTEGFKRRLTAILSADVEGHSRLMEDDEEATVRTITAYRELIVSQIQNQNGRVVDAKGDNLLAEFSSVVDAVRCAAEIQRDIFAIQDEIALKILTALQVKLTDGEQAQMYAKGTENIEAYLKMF